jgi:hypothetical protein
MGVKLEKDEFDSAAQVKKLTLQINLKFMGVKLEKDEFDSGAQVDNPSMQMILKSIPFKLEKDEINLAAQERNIILSLISTDFEAGYLFCFFVSPCCHYSSSFSLQ